MAGMRNGGEVAGRRAGRGEEEGGRRWEGRRRGGGGEELRLLDVENWAWRKRPGRLCPGPSLRGPLAMPNPGIGGRPAGPG